jgi:hypothetical protein
LTADPWIGSQFDNLVGSPFSQARLELPTLLGLDLLEPLIAHTGSFEFDHDYFEELYDRIERDLVSDTVTRVVWMPLLGIDPSAEVSSVDLGDGWQLRPMTDHELSLSIDFGTLPNRPQSYADVEERWVSPLDQWALARIWSLPKVIGETLPSEDLGAVVGFGNVAELTDQLVTALRVVAGGVVCAGAAAASDQPQDRRRSGRQLHSKVRGPSRRCHSMHPRRVRRAHLAAAMD